MTDPGVSIPLRDIVVRIDGKLDAVINQLSHKADRSELDRLVTRFEHVERKVNTMDSRVVYRDGPLVRSLEDTERKVDTLTEARAASTALSNWQRWFFGMFLFGLISVIVTLVTLTLRLHG